jgi:hypothetical protein
VTHREFLDLQGQRWEVWEVHPRCESPAVRSDLAERWLAFGSSTEKRRLAPIPAGWNELPAEALGDLCDKAAFVRKRGDSGSWPRFRG